MIKNSFFLLSLMCAGALSSIAYAEEPKAAEDHARWAIGGLGMYQTNIYRDGEAEFNALPWVEFEYGKFSLDRNKITYELYENDWFEIAPVIEADFQGYEAADSPFLGGMKDRDMAFHAGVEGEIEVGPAEIEFGLRQDITGTNKGFIGELSVGLDAPVTDNLMLGASVGAEYYSSKYSDYYYGVTASEARAGRAQYDVGGTINPTIELNAQYRISESWKAGMMAEYIHFDSKISDSPIIDASGQGQVMFGVAYEFYH
jgi:outer membrane protein